MKTVNDLLRDADPLRHEPDRLEAERGRLRQRVVAGASRAVVAPPTRWRWPAFALWATVALVMVSLGAVAVDYWTSGGSGLQAAVRFEVRLAESQPAPNLREARIKGSDAVIYLHGETVVTNDAVAESQVVAGSDPAGFAVDVRFTEEGARTMRQATESHVGKPVAILIDGRVVMAPIVIAPIGGSALITGRFSQAEAERIVDGIGVR